MHIFVILHSFPCLVLVSVKPSMYFFSPGDQKLFQCLSLVKLFKRTIFFSVKRVGQKNRFGSRKQLREGNHKTA